MEVTIVHICEDQLMSEGCDGLREAIMRMGEIKRTIKSLYDTRSE